MNNVVLRGDKKCPHGHTARRKCETCDREDDQAEIARLRAALKGLSDMYARTWDRVDGALVMMPDRVSLFEEAHRQAFIALGDPVYDVECSSAPQPREQT